MPKTAKNKASIEQVQHQVTLNLAEDAQAFIQGALQANPLQMSNDLDSALRAAQLVSGEAVPEPLMARIPELLADDENFMPGQKAAEVNTIKEIGIRAAMQLRPEHFSSIASKQPVEHDTAVEISHEFMKEFASAGAMPALVPAIRQEIANSEAEHTSDYLSFFDNAVSFINYMCSDDVKNPHADPLNKYVNDKELKYIMQLEEWLPNNRQHSEFNQRQARYVFLEEKISKARMQALQEASESMFGFFKKLDPAMANFSDMQAVTDNRIQQAKESTQNDFIQYLIRQYQQKDIFEPNKLRAFWETVYRNQYGEVCYQLVCESFQEAYTDSEHHQLVKNIWAVSILDTSHISPVDARSRMPGNSGDGVATSNFGYAMDHSQAHKQWHLNKLSRACGDVIVDVMQSLVDFALQLELDTFIQRFQLYLKIDRSERPSFDLFSSFDETMDESKIVQIVEDYRQNPHPYDRIITKFAFYLLEYGFDTEFISGRGRNVVSELLRVADDVETILTHAKQHITSFVNFSRNLAQLRPDGSDFVAKAYTNSFVFGIGFKGQRFAAGGKQSIKGHEIHLAFSNAGRSVGGRCFLGLLKSVVRSLHIVDHQYNLIGTEALRYERYHDLIQRHLAYELSDQFCLPDNHWDNDMYDYVSSEREKIENFLIQCEENLKYTDLTPEFKAWLRKPNNWYFIPCGISILTPETIAQDEYAAQKLARNLIFDAVTGRSFSEAYPELIPVLYQAWQTELYDYFRSDKDFQLQLVLETQDDYTQLSEKHKTAVAVALDILAKQTHPDLQASWQADIQDKFSVWRRHREKELSHIMKAAHKSYNKFKKNNKGDLQQGKREINALLSWQLTKRQLPDLPNSMAELSEYDYKKLREEFFKQSDLAQCVEPAFARSLGNDRFFSVMLSKKSGYSSITDPIDSNNHALQLGNRFQQDVIIPCRGRCQRHVMGHLYMSDMLGEQSADNLDDLRTTHGVDGVPDRLYVLR